ncbi:thiamine pyrophosphate-dependent dehydrogenase E1 component subunit alpha [Natrialbaceae archaeon AArc-T1-2]|uniref:thiamine pyrophosphate-dependent dehydrogenase E1 component subunit alpha n=1 Tax=Natrialbaceae archaeon AArc-T1-2 TaxID=3053904 RepID=UPI00255A935C|nr:thiamine pyrophosphate-dependent enzyme [Natrialbaceae archaeon AArc-T1-2]WIV66717.1 thiamine pyrophosphate-dependent enzyme [Natrialbaceae archaeon AArc-T1-2]
MNRVIAAGGLEATSVSATEALGCYRDMVRTRRFDERALALQRRGWMSGYPPFRGQEASQVGAARALSRTDWLVPTYRSNAMQIAHGVPMSDVLLFRRGYAEYASDHELNVFPQAVPIATGIPHAVGIGMAASYDGDDPAVCCYFGDGATSEGDFHEGLNFAGVFDAPVVFLCENNGWAISVPRERQTASETLAGKAEAYGIDGVCVDGNDPLAVFETMTAALECARDGDPVLVESLTYRQGAHTTSDDPDRYRDDPDELPEWRTADPLERYEGFLREAGVLDDDLVDEIEGDAESEVDEAVETAEETPLPDRETVFEHVFADASPRLADQRAWLESVDADRDGRDLEY